MSDSQGSKITGWGSSLPKTVVSNDDLTTIFDTSDEWITERSGIKRRHHATGPFVQEQPPDHPVGGLGNTAAMAIEAGHQALDKAGLSGSEIGLLILCTTSPDQLVPATSAAVSTALGIGGGAMDLNGTCAGFTYGLVTANALIASGVSNILLIGSETLTRITNWKDRSNAFLFGDGAAAVVLQAADQKSLLGWDLGINGELVELLYADHGSWIQMRGQEVFRNAVRVTVDSALASLSNAGVSAKDISLFVPHQANVRIMTAVAERLGIDFDRIASVIEETGNTSSASIPLALIDAASSGRLKQGDLVLMAGFGAGMTWSSAIWRW